MKICEKGLEMDYKKILEEHIKIVNKLRQIDILNELNDKSDIDLSEDEIDSLIKLSSLLSLEEKYHEPSYEISSKLFKNFYEKYENLHNAIYITLSRLGNFPNRELIKEYGFRDNTIDNLALIFEILSRENDNEIYINNEKILLTDFQKQFYEFLSKEKKFSISAPTSAGKSFIFQLSILNLFKEDNSKKVAFIVPTRALIIEFSHKMRSIFKKYNLNIDIRTLPLMKEEKDEGVLYIFTQERLNILLDEGDVNLDVVFIDEAQEIQGNRGVVLQNSVEKLIEKNPEVKLFFASPLIKNPEIFNRIFNFNETKKFTSTVSPVGQNIIFASSIKNKTNKAKIELYKNDEYIPITTLDLDFKFRKKLGKVVDFSIFITKEDDQTIIYSNTPSEAEDNALNLSKKLEIIEDVEIESLIEYIKEDIHPDYSLIKCLKKGVAFHYAHMPSNIKVKIEDLASKGKLKFICCTSTLLQGVNLPAKNIVIYKPKSGRSKQMKRSDFLNLIGRAGRLKKEFNGNIWCIDTQEWENDIYSGEKLQEISSFYENALIKNMDELIKTAKNPDIQNDYEVVFGKFYVDVIIEGKTPIDTNELLEISNNIERKLPDEIYKKHYSLHPEKLNRLYQYLNKLSNFDNILPQRIYSKGNNLKNIIKIIDKYLLNIDNNSYKFTSNMINKWTHNSILRDIILDYHKYNKKSKISQSIKEVLETIEKKIRYKYVLYTSAYVDILKYVLQEKNFPLDTDNLPNLPLYLEVGSGTKEIINLISLGLSRNTSIKLYKLQVVDCDDIVECYQNLKNINIDNLELPYILKEEIKKIL